MVDIRYFPYLAEFVIVLDDECKAIQAHNEDY